MFEIGPSLREARTRRGLSSEDVQKAIRIRDRYLNALEDEKWDMLPGDAYVKGFLRTYAEFLGLNGNLYVDEFNSRYAHREDQALVPEAMSPIETARIGVLRPLAAVVGIVAVVAAVAAWQLHGSSTPPRSSTPPSSSPKATPSPAAAKTSHHAVKSAVTPAVTPTVSHAVLSATRGRVWLFVREGGASGTVLFRGVLDQGQTLPVKLAPKVWFRVGAPWNLDVKVAGHAVSGLPSSVGDVVLTAAGLAPAT